MQIQKKKFIFNISPTRVIGAVAYFDKEKKIPVIDYMSEKNILLENNFSISDFRKETLKAIDQVCLDFIGEDQISGNDYYIDEAEIFLTSP
jgi:hypothetical protein